jgi:hypothetical protein
LDDLQKIFKFSVGLNTSITEQQASIASKNAVNLALNRGEAVDSMNSAYALWNYPRKDALNER